MVKQDFTGVTMKNLNFSPHPALYGKAKTDQKPVPNAGTHSVPDIRILKEWVNQSPRWLKNNLRIY